jgi:serine protease inhibitor
VVDFGDPATVDLVNAWVADQTQGFVTELVESLDSTTVIALLNAVFLEAAGASASSPAPCRCHSKRRLARGTHPSSPMTSTDVTGMAEEGDGLFIDQVRHKAQIEVDEKETTAAAPTGVAIGRVSDPTAT